LRNFLTASQIGAAYALAFMAAATSGEGELMRCFAIVITGALLAATPAAAQTQVPELQPYGLDPYKPSDAAILRTYGSTLLAQTPLLELRQLDPYKPSHAALLRQLGNGVPQWSHFSWYPNAPVPAPLMLPSTPPAMTAAGNQAVVPGGNVVILVPPNGQAVTPRLSPDVPRLPLPVPPQPQQRAPGSVPRGPFKASLTPEQAASILRGTPSPRPEAVVVSADATQETPPIEP
jgi:hypothetical protein